MHLVQFKSGGSDRNECVIHWLCLYEHICAVGGDVGWMCISKSTCPGSTWTNSNWSPCQPYLRSAMYKLAATHGLHTGLVAPPPAKPGRAREQLFVYSFPERTFRHVTVSPDDGGFCALRARQLELRKGLGKVQAVAYGSAAVEAEEMDTARRARALLPADQLCAYGGLVDGLRVSHLADICSEVRLSCSSRRLVP